MWERTAAAAGASVLNHLCLLPPSELGPASRARPRLRARQPSAPARLCRYAALTVGSQRFVSTQRGTGDPTPHIPPGGAAAGLRFQKSLLKCSAVRFEKRMFSVAQSESWAWRPGLSSRLAPRMTCITPDFPSHDVLGHRTVQLQFGIYKAERMKPRIVHGLHFGAKVLCRQLFLRSCLGMALHY